MGSGISGELLIASDSDGREVEKKLNLRGIRFKSEEPAYVKAYLGDLRQILKVNRGDIAVLIELMKFMNYDNIVDVTKRIKEKIVSNMGYGTVNTVNNSIHNLKKAFLIIPLSGRGSYLIDPVLFAKGSWKDICKIKMQITYKSDGSKYIKTEFAKNTGSEIKPNEEFYNQTDNHE